MSEEVVCEELEREKEIIIELLCKSRHALPRYAFVRMDMSRNAVDTVVACLVRDGILCKTEWEHQEAYDLCDRASACVGTSNVSNAQSIADAQGGFMG